MKKTRRLLAGLLSLSLLLCLMPIRSLAADVLTLSSVELSGLAVPVEGQYAVSVDASRVVPGLPEAYQVAEDSLSWKDQYGTVIDNERYAFEAGRIYVLDLTLRVTNPDNYSFGSKVTAVLTGLSSSDYTSKVSYVSKEEIRVELRFTVAGSRTYPDLTGTLNGQTVAVGRAYDQSADEVVCITYHFGICDTTVDFVSVFNLDIPQPGAAPDFDAAVQEMEKYEIAHLRWTGPEGLMLENERFQPGETYEVEIKLVPLKMEGQLLYSFASVLQGYLNARQLDSSDVFASSQTPDYVTGTTTGSYRFVLLRWEAIHWWCARPTTAPGCIR